MDVRSLIGARHMVGKAGMREQRQYIVHEKELRSGKDVRMHFLDDWSVDRNALR